LFSCYYKIVLSVNLGSRYENLEVKYMGNNLSVDTRILYEKKKDKKIQVFQKSQYKE